MAGDWWLGFAGKRKDSMILVTGATGTIGRELVPQLLEAGGRFVFSFATKKRWRKNGLRLRWGI